MWQYKSSISSETQEYAKIASINFAAQPLMLDISRFNSAFTGVSSFFIEKITQYPQNENCTMNNDFFRKALEGVPLNIFEFSRKKNVISIVWFEFFFLLYIIIL